jgi:hypothetical protein
MIPKDCDGVFIARAVKRLRPCVKILNKLGIKNFYMAGNSMNKEPPHDIDIFPVLKAKTIHDLASKLDSDEIICLTKNALTIKSEPVAIQICSYHHKSLKELVESFDFAHIQIGVKVKLDGDNIKIEQVCLTDDFVVSHTIGRTYYTGSVYPLSSLIRVSKYKQQGAFDGASHIIEIIKCLNDVVSRGFESYEDFKDQIDAVDLGLVATDVEDTKDDLMRLYHLLIKGVE